MTKRKQWEYNIVTIFLKKALLLSIPINKHIIQMNELGKEGWELVAVVSSVDTFGYTLYFKREVE